MSTASMEILNRLFETHFGFSPERISPLQGQLGGSGRAIIRLSGRSTTAIGVVHSVREENVAFLEFSRHFATHGLPVPAIYAEDLNHGAYLQEDLGDTTLFEYLSRNRRGDAVGPEVLEAYRQVVAVLPRFQVEAGKDLNYAVCYPRSSFDAQSIAWDLNYFKYYFLRLAGIPFNEQALENDFQRFTEFLLQANGDFFLYRDFQSRNIMLREGRPFFIDYQGGRKGPLHYDIASLLFDAKADLPPQVRQNLLDLYLDELGSMITVDRGAFMQHYYAYVFVRIMQALGAYGFRGFYERKAHFLQSVPYALRNIEWLLANVELPVALPTFMGAFQTMVGSERLRTVVPETSKLRVRVFSFSFRSGPPQDDEGNGGGFVFDARSLPNPGREEQFRAVTGLDGPVIEYLNREDRVHQFLASAIALVDASVTEYQRRGFQNLMVSFGCTGGQHRSVFLAERMARHLRNRSGVDVVIRHLGLEAMGRVEQVP